MAGLQFNVAGLLKELAGTSREYEVEASPEALEGLLEDAWPVAPLQGQVRMLRTQRSVFVRGQFATRVGMECSRCLTELETPIAFDLEAEYFPEIDFQTGQHLPRPDDDLGFMIDENHELDLAEAVRQHVLLALPMRSICVEACKGLCPGCGVDLNVSPCQCQEEPVDARLAPLKALLEGKKL